MFVATIITAIHVPVLNQPVEVKDSVVLCGAFQ